MARAALPVLCLLLFFVLFWLVLLYVLPCGKTTHSECATCQRGSVAVCQCCSVPQQFVEAVLLFCVGRACVHGQRVMPWCASLQLKCA